MASRLNENISRVIAWYKYAKQTGELPFWIVLFIAAYTPFEEFFVRWIPGPQLIPILLRFIPEITLYVILFNLFWQSFCQRKTFKKTPIDLLVIAFFLAAAISIVVNRTPVSQGFINLRVLWRYISVYYIMVNIDVSKHQLSLLLKTLKIVGFIESIITSIQFFLPAKISQVLFAPREFELAGYRRESQAEAGTIKEGSNFGTFDNTAVLSIFLLVINVVFWNGLYTQSSHLIPSTKGDWAYLLFLDFAIFASKKRAALVIAIIIPAIILFIQKRIKPLLVTVWLYAAVGFIIALLVFSLNVDTNIDTSFTSSKQTKEKSIDLAPYLVQIFSPDFWTNTSENSRGWVASVTISTVFESGNWFGFGPDLTTAKAGMANFLPNWRDKYRLFTFGPFEDIYWLAMMAYFGVVGVVIYLLILLRLYQVGQYLIRGASDREYKSLGVAFCTLTIVGIIYAFVERIFKLRTFSLYFWLLAGLVVNAYYSQKEKEKEQ